MKINIKNIKPRTWISIVMVLIVVINQFLIALGQPIIDIGEDQITYIVNTAMNIGFIAYAAWKNMPVTEKAQITEEVLFMLRDGRITKEELAEFIKNHKNPDVPTD